MKCSICNAINDADASFCSECGKPINADSRNRPAKSRRAYLFALLLIPVIVFAAGIGYYKYFPPHGIAAVVNGEDIPLSELDAAVARGQGVPGAAEPRFRYQVLNGLISERLVLQEARKAGITVPQQELSAAMDEARSSAGRDRKVFEQDAAAHYGSIRNFENVLARRLLINKFMTSKVIPPNADPRTANAAINRWMQEISGRASVRVTLAEQWSAAGCGCCSSRAEAATVQPSASGDRMAQAESKAKPPVSAVDRASAAALSYWHAKHGQEQVTTKVTDFGCHMQVDIIRDNKTVASLRYQGGAISE